MSLPRYSEYKETNVDWLGKVPSHWHEAKFRHAFQESGERIESEVFGVMLSVSGYRGIEVKEYDDENRRRSDEDLIGYRIVRPGQLVVNTMWLNYAGLGVSDHEGHVSPAYRAYSISKDFDRRFVHHMMRSELFVRGYTKYLTGVRPNSLQMSREDLMQFRILKPPFEEQVSIAAFLDREAAKIDALIAEQERLLELLAEKRQAVISHAVTKGLNPDAPMKDSGVAWLGEVPAHWGVSRLRLVIRAGTSITYGIVQAGPHIEDGIPYIKTSDMSGTHLPVDGYSKTTPEIDSSYARSKVEVGDLVVAIRASVGKCLPVPPELDGANLTQGTAKISPGESVDSRYLLAYINSSPLQKYFDSVSKGATFKEITLDTLRRTPVLLPPLVEQRSIADHIHRLSEQFQELSRGSRTAIELLTERRSALIAAAVTGQVDVREAT